MAAGFVLSGLIYRSVAQEFPYYARIDLLLLFHYVQLAGLVGGFFPDLDRIDRQILGFRLEHRKTFHYPFGYVWMGGVGVVNLLRGRRAKADGRTPDFRLRLGFGLAEQRPDFHEVHGHNPVVDGVGQEETFDKVIDPRHSGHCC